MFNAFPMLTSFHVNISAKSFSLRLTLSAAIAIFIYAETNSIALSLGAGGLAFFVGSFLYFLHGKIWNWIQFGNTDIKPAVIWFTGLSGSGKSTIAKLVAEKLAKKGMKVEHLDGDDIRSIFPSTGFNRKERDAHIRRVAYLASRLEKNGVTTIVSLMSPYKDSRRFARNLSRNFMVVYVSTSLEVCERRDTKGLYAKARNGEIKEFIGIDEPYEEPTEPEVIIDTAITSPEIATETVIRYFSSHQSRL